MKIISKKTFFYLLSTALLVVAGLLGTAYYCRSANCARTNGKMNQEAYIWQRDWTPSVTSSFLQQGKKFSGIAILAAEISWNKNVPSIFRANPDYQAMRYAGKPVAITLRIGKTPGLFSKMRDNTSKIISLSQSLVSDFTHNGIKISEFQIDFDCAESKLDDYWYLVRTIREAIPNVHLAITALPCWLDQGAFRNLTEQCDSYILQVHSLERPTKDNPASMLCDPGKALIAVEKAGKLGKKFRVALPTYGYLTSFDKNGKFLGLSTEGFSLSRQKNATICEIRSDPETISGLVKKWTADRPAVMDGVVWFRLPVDGDRLNWSWKTLSAVMDGRNPAPQLAIVNRNPGCELAEIELSNLGENDYCGTISVGIRWDKSRIVSSDALRDFQMESSNTGSVLFKSISDELRLAPGGKKSVGWVRFNQKTEVTLDLSSGTY